MKTPENSEMALAGLRVIDMTRVIAGPLASQTFGDLGAEIIKIERPGEGDDVRRVGPPWMPGNEDYLSTYFMAVNRNKSSVTIDFATPKGAKLIRAMIKDADVLMENFRPGTLAKYGLGYEDLREINPRLIYCSVSGFGQTGPYSVRSGYDYLAQAMAGAMTITGLPDGVPGGGPLRVGIPMADIFAGMQANVAVLAALQHREKTGEGQSIDVSLFDAQFAAMMNTASAWLNAGEVIKRTGNDHPSSAPYGVYPVDDGHILIATFSDREFVRLSAALGHPEWSSDERFAKNGGRVENRETLRQLVTSALIGKGKAEWVEHLNAATVSCGPINAIADLEDDPHVQAREMIVEMSHPELGTIRTPAAPYRMSKTPPTYRKAPPLIGEDTDAVLKSTLGLDDAKIAELRRDGIV